MDTANKTPRSMDSSDLRHRFNISAHLRDAEREIDEIHGKWLLSQKACAELSEKVEKLQAMNKEGLDIIEGLRMAQTKSANTDVRREG